LSDNHPDDRMLSIAHGYLPQSPDQAADAPTHCADARDALMFRHGDATKLYDRTGDEITLDEVERITI
jgi:hypothetical protein